MNEISNVTFYLTEAVCALPFESEMKAAQELVLTALKLRILVYEQFLLSTRCLIIFTLLCVAGL